MPALEIIALNVGHGDSFIIKFPKGKCGIIDCNNPDWADEHPVLSELKEMRDIKELSFVCLTHPHFDHYSGMMEILRKYRVREFWSPPVYEKGRLFYYIKKYRPRREFEEFEKLNDFLKERASIRLGKKKIYIIPLTQGVKLRRDYDGVKVYALAPSGSDIITFTRSPSTVSPNRISIILLFIYGNIKIIFGADALIENWNQVLDELVDGEGWDISSNFIKVSHHGSRGSSSERLWDALAIPEKSTAIISVGGNNKNTPHPLTLYQIKKHKVNLYCTNKGKLCSELSQYDFSDLKIHSKLKDIITEQSLPVDEYNPCHGKCRFEVHKDGSIIVTPQNNLNPCPRNTDVLLDYYNR